jgi:hypothetical protein
MDLSKHTELKGQVTTNTAALSSNPVDPGTRKTRALARLHGAVWEATGYVTFDEIRRFVEGTLHEVQMDDQ